MKRLPLKAKFSLGAGLLTAGTILLAGLITRPIIYRVQMDELDHLQRLKEIELSLELKKFIGMSSEWEDRLKYII